jgi:mannosyl-oligosaccharide alpha-1,2-mannosidase
MPPPRRSRFTIRTLLCLLFGLVGFVALGGVAMYAIESNVASVEQESKQVRETLDAMKERLASMLRESEKLRSEVAAVQAISEKRLSAVEDDARKSVQTQLQSLESKLSERQQKQASESSQKVEADMDGVRKDVALVKADVKALDSAVIAIREKLARTPPPVVPRRQREDLQDNMGRNGDNDQPAGQQPDTVNNHVVTPYPTVAGGGAGQAQSTYMSQRRSPNAPAIQKYFSDELDPRIRNEKRRQMVKDEIAASWKAYRKYAWGRDELRPVSKTYKDWVRNSKGVGLSIFDSLSLLILTNMTKDYDAAIDHVLHKVDFEQNMRISVFEATIRIVGSLLSAFELTGETNRPLVDLAARFMDKLLWAYNTSSGVPHQQVNLVTHKHWCPDWTSAGAVLSEFGSIQLELRTLSYHTKNPIYDMKATHQMDIVEAHCAPDMLCPTFVDVTTGMFRDDHLTVGALGDSFYEYLVKQYLLTGKTEARYHDDALAALDAVIRRLLRYSTQSRQAYLAEFMEGRLEHKMDELTCFAGGMFALAAMELADSGRPKEFAKIGAELTKTCYEMWAFQNTGLAPESVEFVEGNDFTNGPGQFLLRPETLESLFYMWRLTHEEKYRDWAWDIFSAVNQYCRVSTGGYTGITNIDIIPPEPDDVQQTFLFAEFFKYLYLIFSDDSLLPLNEWVLNTEAQPLRIRKRNPMDIWTRWEDSHGGSLPWEAPTLAHVSKMTHTARMKKRRDLNPNYVVVAPIDVLAEEEPDPDEEAQQIDNMKAAMDAQNAANYIEQQDRQLREMQKGKVPIERATTVEPAGTGAPLSPPDAETTEPPMPTTANAEPQITDAATPVAEADNNRSGASSDRSAGGPKDASSSTDEPATTNAAAASGSESVASVGEPAVPVDAPPDE